MGLVQNLKKKLNRWVEKVLVELSYHYIIQRAKQTTKKPSNSLVEESSQSPSVMEPQPITTVTSSQGISGKTTLEETDEIVAHIRQWATQRLEDAVTIGEKDAIYREFEEWIELQDEDECEIMSIELEEAEQT